MHITLFDLPPVKEYDLYMSSFGRTNAQQVCETVFPILFYSLSIDPQLSIRHNFVPHSIVVQACDNMPSWFLDDPKFIFSKVPSNPIEYVWYPYDDGMHAIAYVYTCDLIFFISFWFDLANSIAALKQGTRTCVLRIFNFDSINVHVLVSFITAAKRACKYWNYHLLYWKLPMMDIQH